MEYVEPIGGAANDPYVDGNPGTGTPGSPVPAAAVEHPMREIMEVITHAGLTPNGADLTQLRQAIVALATPVLNLLLARGTTVPSAATTNLGAADSDYVEISGTTGITSLGATTSRNHMWVKFQGSLTITHNATSLILPGGADIVTQAGDVAEFVRIGGSNWQCLAYIPASGLSVIPATAYGTTGGGTTVYTITTTPAFKALKTGQVIFATMNATNTGASTLNPNGIGATPLKDASGAALAAGALQANRTYPMVYDGTNLRVVAPLPDAAYGTTAGGTTVYTITTVPAFSAITTGQVVYATINAQNTGAVTLNPNGIGAIGVKDAAGAALASAALLANRTYELVYDGANFRVVDGLVHTSYGTTAGGTTVYTINTVPSFGALFTGQVVRAKFNAANTGAVTLNPNGIGAISVKDVDGNALISDALSANRTYDLVYNGADFVITNLTDSYATQLLHVREEQTAGTNGGSSTSGATQTRVLNTVKTNQIAGASVASNQITLPAGKYLIRARVPASASAAHKAHLYDTTNAAVLLVGSTSASGSTGSSQMDSFVEGRFTLAGTCVLELRHRVGTSQTNTGLGSAANLLSQVEVYSEVMIWKVG